MKKRVTNIVEITRYPLIVLIIAAFFMAIGTILSSTLIFGTDISEDMLMVASLFNSLGSFITINLPLILLISIIGNSFPREPYAAFIGVIGYIVFNVTTMIFAPMGMHPNAYTPTLGIFFDVNFTTNNPASIIFPLQLGIIGAIISGYITFIVYRRFSKTDLYGNLSFINNNILTLGMVLLLNVVFGYLIALVWPFVIETIVNINNFIGQDISSGRNLFIYGFVERILNVLLLSDITHASFWFSDLGGSVFTGTSTSVSGDIAMWTYSLQTGRLLPLVGKFITPYYLINLFMMPAVCYAVYTHNTNRFEKRNQLFLLILVIAIIVISGNSLAVEIFMLVTMPFFFLIHIIIVALLYALLMKFNIVIGHSVTTDSLQTIYPGNILEFIRFSQITGTRQTFVSVIVIGVLLAILYYYLTRYFLRRTTLLPFVPNVHDVNITELIIAVGGIENIVDIDASLVKVSVHLMDVRNIDIERIVALGAYSIHQTRTGYSFNFGVKSRVIRDEMLKLIRNSGGHA